MPWSVKENYQSCKGYGVVDKDGKLIACFGPNKNRATEKVKALYASEPMMKKMEEAQDKIMLEGVGPALVAVAVTAKPHLRQRGQEIKLIEKDGQKYVEVPLLKKGIYRHPKGQLLFDDKFINRMIENHQNKVTDYDVHLDFRHDEKLGSLAFLDPDDGGWLEAKSDGWLYAYGKPADDQAEKIVASRKWRYASPEFAPNYESNFVQKLSSDDLTEIQLEDLMEEHMPKILTLGTKVITLEGEVQDVQVSEIETAFKDATTQLETKVAQLEAEIKKLKPVTEPELPEAYRVRLEALESENRRLEQERRNEKVSLVLERAKTYRDSRGFGHDKTLLDLCAAALKLETFENDGVSIKLENTGKVGDLIGYYSNIFMTMLNKLPGTVPMETRTNGDHATTNPLLSGLSGNDHYTMQELEDAQGKFWE